MAKFGRFDFGSDEPSEIYEGDYMNLEKGYVKILKGRPNFMDLGDEQLVAVINLDKGQSVRRMKRRTI